MLTETINALTLQTLTGDTALAAATCEAIINHAINKINGYAREDILSNMTGTAGTKTLVVSSYQAGFIISVAIAVYVKDYKQGGANSQSTGVGAVSTVTSAGDPDILAAKAAASLLVSHNDLEVLRG